MKTMVRLLVLASFASAFPARAQLGLEGTIKVYPSPPIEKGPTPLKIEHKRAPRGGERVLALSLRGLLTQPGRIPSISSVHGFVVDEKRSDVILIARSGGRGTLDWRDFAEALRSARGGGEAPYCSLDPDPSNPAGEQRLRVGGVRYYSHFGKVMADADYLMKKTAAGLVASPGLSSFGDRLTAYFTDDCSRLSAQGAGGQLNRFWFSAAEPASNDALSSASGKTVWVKARMGLQTEESLATQGGLVGRGRVNPVAAGYARDFSASLTDLSARPEFALFSQLRGLFQWVYISNLALSRAGGDPETALLLSNWSDRLGVIESSWNRYSAVMRATDLSRCGSGYSMTLQGGVQIVPRLPYSLPADYDLDGLEAEVLSMVDAAPGDASWNLASGLPASFFAE